MSSDELTQLALIAPVVRATTLHFLLGVNQSVYASLWCHDCWAHKPHPSRHSSRLNMSVALRKYTAPVNNCFRCCVLTDQLFPFQCESLAVQQTLDDNSSFNSFILVLFVPKAIITSKQQGLLHLEPLRERRTPSKEDLITELLSSKQAKEHDEGIPTTEDFTRSNCVSSSLHYKTRRGCKWQLLATDIPLNAKLSF